MSFIFPDWPAPTNVRAAFTLRIGGVSGEPFDSLNVADHVGDAPGAVRANRKLARELLELPSEPSWLRQVHGTGVVTLEDGRGESGQSGAPEADAAVTRSAGAVCAIQVADCLPVLFAAKDGSAVGAAHAGWRGLSGGVLERTVETLRIEPRHLLAWMGPAIGPDRFEVGDDVHEAFVGHDHRAQSAFRRNARGRWQCDLYALARQRLEAIGVPAVRGGGWCTFADPARFFSYRRNKRCGRMAALIWLARH